MQHFDWADIQPEQMNPLITRQMFHSETMTVARIQLRAGAVVPPHQHANEQITMLQSGRLRFEIDGVERTLGAGEMQLIAPHARHRVEALDDSVAIDLFCPRREDWIRGEDAYLRDSKPA